MPVRLTPRRGPRVQPREHEPQNHEQCAAPARDTAQQVCATVIGSAGIRLPGAPETGTSVGASVLTGSRRLRGEESLPVHRDRSSGWAGRTGRNLGSVHAQLVGLVVGSVRALRRPGGHRGLHRLTDCVARRPVLPDLGHAPMVRKCQGVRRSTTGHLVGNHRRCPDPFDPDVRGITIRPQQTERRTAGRLEA
mgnify:FL=1